MLSLLCISSCANMKNIATEQNVSFNAVVGKIGGDCGSASLLTLFSDGKPMIQPVYEINLADSLKIEGMKLLVEWRKPKAGEMIKCTTLGPGYEQIYILNSKRAE